MQTNSLNFDAVLTT